ncbi:MAG: tetratricopeptide repeat protein, partial [Nitrospira sp.]
MPILLQVGPAARPRIAQTAPVRIEGDAIHGVAIDDRVGLRGLGRSSDDIGLRRSWRVGFHRQHSPIRQVEYGQIDLPVDVEGFVGWLAWLPVVGHEGDTLAAPTYQGPAIDTSGPIGFHGPAGCSSPEIDMAGDAAHRGRIFLHRGDLTQARQCYETAVSEDRARGDDRALSDSLGNLGNVCAMLGEVETAEGCYREALDLQRQREDRTAIGQTLTNLGNLHADSGRHERARSYYLEACDLLEATQDQRALGILYSNLALQDSALG